MASPTPGAKRKRDDSPPRSKPAKSKLSNRKIRSRFIESDAAVTSLEFHPSSNTFAASRFDGKINLYNIDDDGVTSFSHSLVHPYHDDRHRENVRLALKQVSQKNKETLARIKELQSRNNIKVLDDEDEDQEDIDIDDDDKEDVDDDGDIQSDVDEDEQAFLESNSNSADSSSDMDVASNGVVCKQSMFSADGAHIFGAWQDGIIGVYDTNTCALLHHFKHTQWEDEEESLITAMKVYSERLMLSGDNHGIIRCWDVRVNPNSSCSASSASPQRQFQYLSTSMLHNLHEHSNRINCFESVAHKHRVFAGGADGQLSVWDLRKSSDLNAIKAQMERKKAAQRKILQRRCQNKRDRFELFEKFALEESMPGADQVQPKTLKSLSESLGDEIQSLCLMKYGAKLCCGMTSGFINVFSWGRFEWFKDRVKGHATNLTCIVKYDEDCCITGCDDGVVRLISIYPNKFVHCIGSHELNSIDHIALSRDKRYVVSFAAGNSTAMMTQNRTNRTSLHRMHRNGGQQVGEGVGMGMEKEVIKVWNMGWNIGDVVRSKESRKERIHAHIRYKNRGNLAKGVKDFLELSEDDLELSDVEEIVAAPKSKKRKVADDYEWSDDSLDDEEDEDEEDDSDEVDSSDDDSDDSGEEVTDKKEDEEDDSHLDRRIRYKIFSNREQWLKQLGKRKKIRKVGRHDLEQYNNKKFFRDLCL